MADTPGQGGSGVPAPSDRVPIWERPEDLSFAEPRPIPSFDAPPVVPTRADGPASAVAGTEPGKEQRPHPPAGGEQEQPPTSESRERATGPEAEAGTSAGAGEAPKMPGFAVPEPPTQPEPEAPETDDKRAKPKKKRRWWVWAGCGCVVVVAVAVVLFAVLGGLTIFGLELVMKDGLPRIEREVGKDPAYLQLMSDLTRIKAGQTQAVYDSASRRFKEQTTAEDWNTQVGSIPVLMGWTSVADPALEHQLVRNEQLGDLELAIIRLDVIQGASKQRFEFQYVKEDGQYKLMYVGKATE